MKKSIILIGAMIGMLAATSAGARTWRQTVDGYLAAQDKRWCRWDGPSTGGPACRITRMHEQRYTRGSAIDKLNGWQARQEIRFDAVYYNGQLWSEAYDAFVVLVKTREGWKVRYSSLGNGGSEVIPFGAVR